MNNIILVGMPSCGKSTLGRLAAERCGFAFFDADAELEPAEDYTYTKPILYYGSSITQGGCANRPGTSYQAIIHRSIDADYINLGFSGSCLAEDAMLDYISNLDMSVFVYDYDHNAPTPEFLEKTHEPFYKKLRERRPDLPIIMVSAPTMTGGMWTVRREHIKSNYEKGIAAGDKNLVCLFNMKS